MRIHALLFFFFAQSAFALYGGRPVAHQKHLVNLVVNNEVFCQGVVIESNRVLTSGHCIEGMGLRLKENSQILTYYPEFVKVKSGNESVSASVITFAPTMFDSPDLLSEDLALIELSRPLKNAEVLPFASKADLAPGKSVVLSSLGAEASVPVRQIRKGTESFVVITEGSRSGLCQGDSGGALLVVKNGKKYLAGVLAARANGCQKRHSVSYFPRREFNF
jgi:secreted trypsin-like serine protease